jgi:hypothetical protein
MRTQVFNAVCEDLCDHNKWVEEGSDMSANEAGDNTHQTNHQARSVITKKGREAQHTDISSEHQSGEVGEDELNTPE